jgi:hypothetical protein
MSASHLPTAKTISAGQAPAPVRGGSGTVAAGGIHSPTPPRVMFTLPGKPALAPAAPPPPAPAAPLVKVSFARSPVVCKPIETKATIMEPKAVATVATVQTKPVEVSPVAANRPRWPDVGTTSPEAALIYATDHGFLIFPCRGKSPLIPGGFKNASKDPETVKAWWAKWPDANIGMATGAPSGFFVLDVDVKPGKNGEATLTSYTSKHGPLPYTRRGRTPSGGWHYWFVHPTAGGYSTVEKLGKGLDTRGDGGYVIIPPGHGLNGGEYIWENSAAPFAEVPAWVLDGIAKRKASPTTKTEATDTTNTKRKASRKTIESALAAIDPSCPYQQWLEIGMALHNWNAAEGLELWDTWSKPGKAYTPIICTEKWEGFTAGDGIEIATLFHHAKEAGWVPPEPDHITRLNLRHAVCMIKGQATILTEEENGEVSFSKPSDWGTFYRNDAFTFTDSKGKTQQVPVFESWIRSPQRRTYRGTVFEPSQKVPADVFNLWRGFGVSPKQGDWSLMRQHIYQVICNDTPAYFDWLMAWTARIVQDPGGERPGTAVVLKGAQGTGKGVFVSNYGKMFGQHYLHLIDDSIITGRFNSMMRGTVLAFADEALFAGDQKGANKLKGIITEREITTEDKGINPVKTRNHVNIIMASNNSWVIPAEWDSRRFFVLSVATHYKQDIAYFEALQNQMAAGGLEAWMYDLQKYPWQDFDLRNPPKTEALMEQKLHSLDPVRGYWQTCLDDGAVLTADEDLRFTTPENWPDEVKAGELHRGYILFCRQLAKRHPVETEVFFRQLREYTGHPFTMRRDSQAGRKRFVALPDYETARDSWVKRLRGGK